MTEKNSKIYYLASSENPTDAKYIGLTGKTLEARLKRHLKDKRSPTYRTNWIEATINRGFEVIITLIEDDLTFDESMDREIYWIADYKRRGHILTNSTNGGNATEVWKTSQSLVGRIHSDKTREKFKESWNKRPRKSKQSTIDKMNSADFLVVKEESIEAVITPKYVKQGLKEFTDEHRANISKALKGRKPRENYDNMVAIRSITKIGWKPVIQFSMDGKFIAEYVSAMDAARKTDSCNKKISSVCTGSPNRISHNGFIWKFKE